MKYIFVFCSTILAPLLITTSCLQNKKEKSHNVSSTEAVASTPTLENYWDQYDFTDTVAMKNPNIGEQAFVNFIGLLQKVPADQVSSQIHHMLSEAEADSTVFIYFKEWSKRYLYHPNSPLYNENYYKSVLAFLTKNKWTGEVDRLQAKKTLELIQKNNPGQPAVDFSFRLPNGKTGKISEMQLPHLVLFFYEPGCSSCEESIDQLTNSPRFTTLLGNGEVEVLAVYTSGDLKIWKDYQSSLPTDWTNAYDENMSIMKDDLYDLKAWPTIYLLDKDKKVILKDTDVATLLRYLTSRQ